MIGKREDIGWLVDAPPIAVELAHLAVANNDDAEGRARLADGHEHGAGEIREMTTVERVEPLPVDYLYLFDLFDLFDLFHWDHLVARAIMFRVVAPVVAAVARG
jgi:hypothetical protein